VTTTKTFVANRKIKISAKCQFTVGASACNVNLLIQEGATVLASQELFAAASSPQGRVCSVILTPSAGSHTYKLTVSFGDNATNLLAASATNPSFILVEDMGSA